jgi:hypothetical protein
MSDEEIFKKMEPYVDREILKIIQNLSADERKVLKYFLQNISVGIIIAIRELKALHRIQDPKAVIRSLIDKGLLEQGYGCYSLAKHLRKSLFRLIQNRS